MSKLKVAELFAGVGGFRLGLEGWKGKSALSGLLYCEGHDLIRWFFLHQESHLRPLRVVFSQS